MTQAPPLPLPAELLICPWGQSVTNTGQIILVDETTLVSFASTQTALGAEEVALDFEHGSFIADQDPLKKADPIRVAAYGAPICRQGVGIVMTLPPDKWTEDGRAFYTGGHYRDVSPVIKFAADGRTVRGVTSVALTRRGAIQGLHAYSATTMTEQDTTALKAQYDALLKGLTDYLKQAGVTVPANPTPEDILKALAEAKPPKQDTPPPATPPATDKGGESALSAELASLKAELGKIAAGQDMAHKSALLDKAVSEGKQLPLARDKMMAFSADQIADMVAGLAPGVVPFSVPATPGGQPATPPPLTAEQKTLCSRMGITEEAFSATLNKELQQ